jgi:hypothetical protein
MKTSLEYLNQTEDFGRKTPYEIPQFRFDGNVFKLAWINFPDYPNSNEERAYVNDSKEYYISGRLSNSTMYLLPLNSGDIRAEFISWVVKENE